MRPIRPFRPCRAASRRREWIADDTRAPRGGWLATPSDAARLRAIGVGLSRRVRLRAPDAARAAPLDLPGPRAVDPARVRRGDRLRPPGRPQPVPGGGRSTSPWPSAPCWPRWSCSGPRTTATSPTPSSTTGSSSRAFYILPWRRAVIQIGFVAVGYAMLPALHERPGRGRHAALADGGGHDCARRPDRGPPEAPRRAPGGRPGRDGQARPRAPASSTHPASRSCSSANSSAPSATRDA